MLTWKDGCFHGRCDSSLSLPGAGFDLLSAGPLRGIRFRARPGVPVAVQRYFSLSD